MMRSMVMAAALLATAGPAAAERVFFDDFEGETGGTTALRVDSLRNFVVDGLVDVIAPDNGLGVDVDSTVIDLGGGITGGDMQLREFYRWEAGDTVTVSFDIGGSQLPPGTADVPFMQFDFLTDSEDYVDVYRFQSSGWYY